MHHSRADRRPHLKIRIALLFTVAVASIGLLAAGAAGGASAQGSVKVAKRSQGKVLGHTVLTNLKGHTLYSLSAEKNGTFICTASDCTALWRPLSVPAGKTPIGPVPLGTVTRPDSSIQVTYKGRPLYTFKQDTKAGQAKGQGFKDVGTWRAAVVPTH